MTSDIAVSVIIPVYNAEKYLYQCLDSIINQTLKEIEIICVDDGSTDGSLDILRQFENRDSRVKVLTQQNQYAGVARNHGMALAKGAYYSFLDADDYFESDMLEKMYIPAKKYSTDICLCAADQFDAMSGLHEATPWFLDIQEITHQPFCASEISNIFFITTPCPWTKLFSADLIQRNHLQFQDTPRINDMYFTYVALALADKIVYINEPFVHYRIGQNTNLQSGVYKTPTLCGIVLCAIKERLSCVPQWEILQYSFINYTIRNLLNNIKGLKNYPDAQRVLIEDIKSNYLHTLGIDDCPDERISDRESFYELLSYMVPNCGNNSIQSILCEKQKYQEARLTVIVPIYNVEKYLNQCLMSLLFQTDTNIKVILVNDGSTDKSGRIAESFANEHPEIFSYIYQENKGLGSARNTGLRFVETPYVTFLDSDDWWPPRNVENIYSAIENSAGEVDVFFTCPTVFNMATFGFSDWSDNERVKALFKQYGNVLSAHTIQALYDTEASVCRMVIKTSVLKEHCFAFPEGIKWEDVFPHFAILRWSKQCGLIDNAGFVYRVNTGTQTTMLSDSRRLDIIPAFSVTFDFAAKNMELSEVAYIYNMLMSFISWFLRATNKEVYPLLVKELHNFIKQLPKEYYYSYCEKLSPKKKTRVLWYFLKSDVLYRIIASENTYQDSKRLIKKLNKWRRRICQV